jgi:hypothetical protein
METIKRVDSALKQKLQGALNNWAFALVNMSRALSPHFHFYLYLSWLTPIASSR